MRELSTKVPLVNDPRMRYVVNKGVRICGRDLNPGESAPAELQPAVIEKLCRQRILRAEMAPLNPEIESVINELAPESVVEPKPMAKQKPPKRAEPALTKLDVSLLSLAELQQECQSRGLRVLGNQKQLRNRILAVLG